MSCSEFTIENCSLAKIAVYLYVICIFTPIIQSRFLLAPCLIGLFFFLITLPCWARSVCSIKLLLYTTLLMLVAVVYRIIGISSAATGNYANFFLAYISFWMGVYICKYMPESIHHSIVKFSTIVLIVNIIDNVRLYSLFPELIGTGSFTNINFFDKYGFINLGKTAFNYMVMFLTIFMFCCCLSKRKKIYFSLFVLLSLYLFVYGGSGTILISFLLGVFLIYFLGRDETEKKSYFKVIILFSLFLIFIIFSDSILSFIIKILEPLVGEKVTDRLTTIMHLLDGNLNSKDLSFLSRINFLRYDIEVWCSSVINFLLGKGYHTTSGISMKETLLLTGDGGHSGFVDLIPRYGVIGLSLCIGIVNNVFCFRKECKCRGARNMFLILFLLFIFNNIFNSTLDCGSVFILSVFFPLIYFDNKVDESAR